MVRHRATRSRVRALLVPLLVSVAASVGLVLTSGSAHAATNPSFEPDPGSVGALSFYNASGVQITSGSINDSPQAAYYGGAGGGIASGDNKANMVYYTPQDGVATASWTTGEIWTSTQTFGASVTYPGALAGTTHAVVKGAASDGSLNGHIANFPSASTLNPGIYQVRLYTTQVGGGGNSTYYSADVLVSGTTWTQVYPSVSVPTPTSTSVVAAPASPQNAGTTVTFTATVAPAAAGTVQFKDGGTNLGSPVTVSAGQAQLPTSALTAGTHTVTAVFAPSNPSAFSASTSTATSYVINAVAVPTTTGLAVAPATPITQGTLSTLTATVSPNTAVGSVQFFDGTTAIGTSITVSNGSAVTSTTFTAGTHSLKASFTPTNSADFTTSTSSTQSYVVSPAATATSTQLVVTEASPQPFGTTLHLTGNVSPSTALGTVQFLDGTTVIGSGAAVNGSFSTTDATLNAGSHTVSAKFVPTNSATFAASQSAGAAFQIDRASTSTSLSTNPATSTTQGTPVTVTATVTPAIAGSVQFKDGTTNLGAPVTVSNGMATTSTNSLTVATHSLTAVFAPTSANYAGSTSSPVSLDVTAAPPGSTTTNLTVTPPAPVTAGTTQLLSATVSPNTATGTVQFYDGVSALGSPVTLAGGTAQTSAQLAQGTHSLTAKFVSSAPASFADSTSAAVSYLIKPPPTPTTTTLALNPSVPISFGSAVTLQASVSPASAAGSVEFFDGSTSLGTRNLSGGVASLLAANLAGGSHSLTVHFTPSVPLDFAASQSDASSLTVDPASTGTSLAAAPSGPVAQGQSVTLTATVTPAVAGSVDFFAGSTKLGSHSVSGGSAALTTTALPSGSAALTATFTPTIAADFATSTSDVVTLQVLPAPRFDHVMLNGTAVTTGGSVPAGSSLTITGAGFAPTSTVTVQAHSKVITLATTTANADGNIDVTLSLPTTLKCGPHTLSLLGTTGTATYQIVLVSCSPSSSGSSSPTGTDTSTPTGTDTSTPSGADSSSSTDPGVTVSSSTWHSGSGSGLAETGANVATAAVMGLLMLGIGAGTVTLSRRRHSGSHRAR